MNAAYPGEWHALTPREKGMLKTFAENCLGLGLYVDDVFDYAIKHWNSFVKVAERDHGAFNTPAKPTIEFLLKYTRAAVNLWLAENHMEIRDGGPRPKVPEPSKPQVTISEPAKPAASIAPRKFRDMEFDPPVQENASTPPPKDDAGVTPSDLCSEIWGF